MELCCELNPTRGCTTCSLMFCEEHVYKTVDQFYPAKQEFQCFTCYNIKVREPLLKTKRSGLSAKALYREVRKLLPKGYMTIDVHIMDGNPGIIPFSVRWTIYHQTYKSVEAATPEEALRLLKEKISGALPKVAPLDNINV